jgi:hypothetical protein
VLEELPGRVGVVLDEAPKLPDGRDEGLEVRLRRDGRRSHAVAEECDLAEVVTGAEDGQIPPVGGDAGRTVGDDEESDPPLVSLLDHDRVGREGTLGEGVGQSLELLRIEAREKRNAAERLHGVYRHAAIVRFRARAV